MSQRVPPVPLDDPPSSGGTTKSEVQKPHGKFPIYNINKVYEVPFATFAVLTWTPELYPPLEAMADAIQNQEGFDPRARELAVMAVVSVCKIRLIRFDHAIIIADLGFSEKQVCVAYEGTTPAGITEVEAAIYRTALALARSRSGLDEKNWHIAVNALGLVKVVRLAHVVGLYLYAATLLNLRTAAAPLGWDR